ncbi:MAG: GNAT family N-acetyltransferase [Anaerolineae bacterium]|nr:GNAT family N-acetyltransferase [Anaerolineae bacterium]
MNIQRLNADSIRQHFDELVELLQNAVDDGASIGFYPPPLAAEEARAYWEGIAADIQHGRVVIAALVENRVVGCVQMKPETRRNQLHRGDVQKLMVHTQFRRQGIGQALIQAVDQAAREIGLTLLVLDVVAGADAERVYQRQGYTLAGTIPNYARSANGLLEATVYYYRLLEP